MVFNDLICDLQFYNIINNFKMNFKYIDNLCNEIKILGVNNFRKVKFWKLMNYLGVKV